MRKVECSKRHYCLGAVLTAFIAVMPLSALAQVDQLRWEAPPVDYSVTIPEQTTTSGTSYAVDSKFDTLSNPGLMQGSLAVVDSAALPQADFTPESSSPELMAAAEAVPSLEAPKAGAPIKDPQALLDTGSALPAVKNTDKNIAVTPRTYEVKSAYDYASSSKVTAAPRYNAPTANIPAAKAPAPVVVPVRNAPEYPGYYWHKIQSRVEYKDNHAKALPVVSTTPLTQKALLNNRGIDLVSADNPDYAPPAKPVNSAPQPQVIHQETGVFARAEYLIPSAGNGSQPDNQYTLERIDRAKTDIIEDYSGIAEARKSPAQRNAESAKGNAGSGFTNLGKAMLGPLGEYAEPQDDSKADNVAGPTQTYRSDRIIPGKGRVTTQSDTPPADWPVN
jgi:hypothetical protein